MKPLLAAVFLLAALGSHAGDDLVRACRPGADFLTDEELAAFLGRFGDQFPPGTRIPNWASEYARRLSIPEESPPALSLVAGQSPANINITNDPSMENGETSIAVDPSNPSRVIVGAMCMWHCLATDWALFFSTDAGVTWQRSDVSSVAGHADPSVAWDSSGTGYVCTIAMSPSATTLEVARTLDGGASWSGSDIIDSAAGGSFPDKPIIAANEQPGGACANVVAVAWTEFLPITPAGTYPSEIWVASSGGGMAPWTRRKVAAVHPSDEWKVLMGAMPAFGPDGELYAAWANYASGRIEIVRSDDCGASFSLPAPIAALRTNAMLTVASGDRILAYPAIAVDRSSGPRRGTLFAAWTDVNQVNPGTPGISVFWSRSNDGGLTWSAPATVHPDLPLSYHFLPWTVVDASGNLHVAWHDTRDTTKDRVDVYYRRSTDGGATWDPEVRVSSGSSRGVDGHYDGLAVSPVCGALPVWADNPTGGTLAQASTAIIPAVASPPPPAVGNTVRAIRQGAKIALHWDDLRGGELDYHVGRWTTKNPASSPAYTARTGSPDAVDFVDAPPASAYYRVQAVGACDAALEGW